MAEQERGRRVAVQGVVTSAKMDKTIVVEVQRLVKHPTFGKYIRRWERDLDGDGKPDKSQDF